MVPSRKNEKVPISDLVMPEFQWNLIGPREARLTGSKNLQKKSVFISDEGSNICAVPRQNKKKVPIWPTLVYTEPYSYVPNGEAVQERTLY